MTNEVFGIANNGKICQKPDNIGIAVDREGEEEATPTILAHEIGHLFFMPHDYSEKKEAANDRFGQEVGQYCCYYCFYDTKKIMDFSEPET